MTDRRRNRRKVEIDRSDDFHPDGAPRRPINDLLVANHMLKVGFTEADVLHVIGYMPDVGAGLDGIPGTIERLRTEARPSTDEEKRMRAWLDGTVAVDQNGASLVLCHGTSPDTVIEEFRPFAHFGTREAALRRCRDLGRSEPQLIEVRLRILNPLRLRDSGRDSQFCIPDLVNSLPESFWEDMSSDEMDILLEGDEEEAERLLIGYVSDFGYDGIVYENPIEGGVSYVIFDPDQVWFVGADEPRKAPLTGCPKP